jgi:hypothetical protein
MKRILIVMLIALGTYACKSDHGHYTTNDTNELQNEADTSAISGEFNSRGALREGLPQHGASDTLGGDKILEENNVPSTVTEKIHNDPSLSNRQITNVRQFARGDTTFYELTYDGESSNKVVFDQYGYKGGDQ